jgi:hypothetical protein
MLVRCCMQNFTFKRSALRKFPAGVCKMKNESLSPSERVQVFTRELGLALRRITKRMIAPDLPPVVQPVERQEEPEADIQDE